MQAWLTDLGISNTKIGLLCTSRCPILLKPLWAPLLDRYTLALARPRRGWIALIQLMLAARHRLAGGFSAARTSSPRSRWCCSCVVFLSASQDIVIDAYRTDVARPARARRRGRRPPISDIAHFPTARWRSRSSSPTTSAGAPRSSRWRCAMALMTLATIWAPEPDDPRGKTLPTLAESVLIPLRELFGRAAAWSRSSCSSSCYKVGDAFALKFFTAFLLDDRDSPRRRSAWS